MSRDAATVPDLAVLEERLAYRFQNHDLLLTALQHSSYANERRAVMSNERLEFLGDSVIGLVIAHLLYEAHPDWPEGDLSRALHSLVNEGALADLGRSLGIGAFLRLGPTEVLSGGSEKAGIVADSVEAVLGAMYLDGGLAPVVRFAKRVFQKPLARDAAPVPRDPKSRLQEELMAEQGSFPTYECIRDTGIDGDESRFTVRVLFGGVCLGEGTARRKRNAERKAAAAALRERAGSDATERS